MDERPEPYADVFDVWLAFNQLHRARTAGFMQNPLSVSDILAYLDLLEITDIEDRQEWFYLITQMDAEFLEIVKEQNANAKTSN